MPGSRLVGIFMVVVFALSGVACGQPAAPTPAVVVVTATPAPAAPTTAPTTAPAAAPTAAPTAASAGSIQPASPTPAAAAKPADSSIKPGEATKPATEAGGAVAGRSSGKSEVHALWFASGPQGPTGGTSKAIISVERNTGGSKELRVGFFEQEVGGSGAMWRAAGWMSVIMSGLLLGIDPNEYRYSYDVGGRLDGPSAGALMTIGTIAAVLGHSIKTDVAMTGTINPDGTIGPVGGIPHKIDGAAAAKKKLVLVPAGSRQSLDMATKQMVDVVDRGRRQGVEVREVSDIYEAYEMITGSQLPKPVGMREVRPQLPGASFERTRAKAKEWYTRYWQLKGQYDALPANFKFDFTDSLMNEAAKAGDKADAYYGQGLPSAAYNRAFNATLYSSIGYNSSKVIEAFMGGGFDGASKYLGSMRSVKLKIDGFIDRLETVNAATLGDVLAISDAYGNVTLGMGLISIGDAALKQEAKTDEQVIANLTQAVLMYAMAEHLVELAKDSIDIGMGFGKVPPPTPDKIESMAELFRRAAEANMNYFETIVINEAAEGAGLHPSVIKSRLAARDFSYTFSISTLNAMNELKKRALPGAAGSYATLGGSLNSYTLSSVLVAKYYSLGVVFDKEGNIAEIQNERAMINMLDFAEKRAKEIIGFGVNLGADPVQPVIAYEGAKIDREGGVADKLNALQGFWAAALQGQIMGTLSGKASIVR